jgi:hypothetical protein
VLHAADEVISSREHHEGEHSDTAGTAQRETGAHDSAQADSSPRRAKFPVDIERPDVVVERVAAAAAETSLTKKPA